jgi:uncharacterized protein (TIGR02246 family)|nr:nuclear transport factor 2 family protein [Kofleriaceae bacterium]
MRSVVSVAAMVVAALAVGCPHGGASGPATPGSAAATPKDVVDAARAALEQWRQAYEVRSEDVLASLYEHDPDVVVVLEGAPLIGWGSVEAMLKDRLSRADSLHVRLKDVQVASLAPTVALVTATMTREIQGGATTVTENGTLTLVMKKQADAWLIAAEHYSYKHP